MKILNQPEGIKNDFNNHSDNDDADISLVVLVTVLSSLIALFITLALLGRCILKNCKVNHSNSIENETTSNHVSESRNITIEHAKESDANKSNHSEVLGTNVLSMTTSTEIKGSRGTNSLPLFKKLAPS